MAEFRPIGNNEYKVPVAVLHVRHKWLVQCWLCRPCWKFNESGITYLQCKDNMECNYWNMWWLIVNLGVFLFPCSRVVLGKYCTVCLYWRRFVRDLVFTFTLGLIAFWLCTFCWIWMRFEAIVYCKYLWRRLRFSCSWRNVTLWRDFIRWSK